MSIFNFNLYKQKSQMTSGFLLLEISVTLAIIMILSLYVYNWYNRVITEHIIFNQKIEALNLACNIIESYKSSEILNKYLIKDLDKNLAKSLIVDVKFEKDNKLKDFVWLIIFITLSKNSEKIMFKAGIIL